MPLRWYFFIHWGRILHLWDLQMPRLTKHYRVVRLDIRGHGLSAAKSAIFNG